MKNYRKNASYDILGRAEGIEGGQGASVGGFSFLFSLSLFLYIYICIISLSLSISFYIFLCRLSKNYSSFPPGYGDNGLVMTTVLAFTRRPSLVNGVKSTKWKKTNNNKTHSIRFYLSFCYGAFYFSLTDMEENFFSKSLLSSLLVMWMISSYLHSQSSGGLNPFANISITSSPLSGGKVG